jgi:peptide/nickel transport system ATP-binding protein
VPPITNLPPGCAFEPRCSMAIEACRAGLPPLIEAGPNAFSRCIRSHEL